MKWENKGLIIISILIGLLLVIGILGQLGLLYDGPYYSEYGYMELQQRIFVDNQPCEIILHNLENGNYCISYPGGSYLFEENNSYHVARIVVIIEKITYINHQDEIWLDKQTSSGNYSWIDYILIELREVDG